MSEQVIGLTEANFTIFAAKHYDSIFYDTIEFQEDMKRFAYVKRLFNQYRRGGELKERLILNHLVVIYNMWPLGATPMLFVKLKGYEDLLKTFLTFMERMPDSIVGIGVEHRTIYSSDIVENQEVLEALKKECQKI